jgi:ankyrin repeat protein
MRTHRNCVNTMLTTAAILACMLLPVSAVAAGPSVNEQLLQAAKKGSLEKIKTLLAEGGDVNAKGNYRRTVLMNAARSGNLEVVKFLIDKGADVNARTIQGRTALIDAAWGGNLEVVKLLIDKGADVNAKRQDGWTVLMCAADWQNQLPDLSAKDEEAETALDAVAMARSLEVVKLLIDKGADVNAKDETGQTALSLASVNTQLEIVLYLKGHGAK